LGLLDANKANDIAQSLLPYALGSNLDFLGQIYGVTRLPAVDASSSAPDNTFQFYVLGGNFGSINNGQPFTIPAGTLIYTSDPNGPVMATSGDVTRVLSTGGSKLGLARLALGLTALGLPSPAHRRFCEREPCRTGTCSPHASGSLLPPSQVGPQAEMSDEAGVACQHSGALCRGEAISAACACLRAGRTWRKRRYRGRDECLPARRVAPGHRHGVRLMAARDSSGKLR